MKTGKKASRSGICSALSTIDPLALSIESSTGGARHESQKPLAVPVQFAAKIEVANASQVMAEVTWRVPAREQAAHGFALVPLVNPA